MASLYDDPYRLRQPTDDITGGQQLPPAASIPTPQPNALADQMATLVANMQASPGGGTVTIDQPAGGATPVRTTTAPVNTLDMNTQPDQEDPMVKLAASIGSALNQPVTQPTLPVSPADAMANYQGQRNIANRQAMDQQATADAMESARTAGQRVTQEFPGQTPSMFPEGLSKTLPGGRTFKAMPSGGYASTQSAAGRDAEVAARRANYQSNIAGTSAGRETQQRSDLFNKLSPGAQGDLASNMNRGGSALTTEQLIAMTGGGQGPPDTAQRLARDRAQLRNLGAAPTRPALVPTGQGYRPAAGGGATDAMSNPEVLRAIIANNKYDVGLRKRAQQRLSRL